jgi:hypothetical protein
MKNKLLTSPFRDAFRHAYIEVDKAKKTITHYITGGEPNRYHQVVNIAGYDDTEFRKNPRVLFNHGDSDFLGTLGAWNVLDFVIARNEWIIAENNLLKAKTEMRDSSLAGELFDLYESKQLDSWSKHFYPISQPVERDGNVYYDKWGMYEYSACVIPVDTNATTISTSIEVMYNSVKNPYLKNALGKMLLKNSIETDPETLKFMNELKTLNEAFDSFKNEFSQYKTNAEKEKNEAIKNAINQYNQIMSKKFLEIVGSVNSLAETVKDMPQLLINNIAGAIRKAQGKLD